MLTRLSIRNVVLIEALDLDFTGGLGVLTGETGAGKSILLDALGLVLGDRADSALVRTGEDKASVSATFEFSSSPQKRGPLASSVEGGARRPAVPGQAGDDGMPQAIADVLSNAAIEIEPGEPLIIKRQVKAAKEDNGGGSKAWVNDQPVGVALLRELAAGLVELHGQHDDRGLVNARGHRGLLDRYAGGDVEGVGAAWRGWRAAEDALGTGRARVNKAGEDRDLLLAYLEELTALAPEEGEELQLAEARATMQKGERLSGDLAELQHLWAGSDSALAGLRSAARKLDRIAAEHPLLTEALAALDRAVIEASEAETSLSRAGDALRHDPQMLDQIETRLFELRAAARKHSCAVDDLAAKARAMRSELDAIESGEAELAGLERAAQEAGLEYQARAESLSVIRFEASQRLDRAVAAELVPLRLDTARFRTKILRLPDDRWGPRGIDAVEFLISTNPGADFAALGKIASGGELSRFILALKVALAQQGGAATVIFDEIDRGVGGAVASAIGERLALLASGGQLLAVTHSPQVAARGGTHYVIAKSSEGVVTRTSVVLLDSAGRQEEIARMLSGAEITPEARAQADRLLEGV